MVAIGRHDSAPRKGRLAGILRPFVVDFLRPFGFLSGVVRRQFAAERQRKRIRIAERISARAGQPASAPAAEPPRTGSAAITSRLTPRAIEAETVAGTVTNATAGARANLDRIDYELTAIRAEITPYLPG